MPIDRATTLRNAEKLLRQGKLDLAIEEYRQIVEEQPRDWNTGNLLGDLFARTGQPDKAVEQFMRIADTLAGEGFASKAAALYKKVLKIAPDNDHALLQAGSIAGEQGLLLDARGYLNAVGDRRRSRGDERGAAEIVVRLGALDPADTDARLAAARARLVLDDREGAAAAFASLADDLSEKGRGADAEAVRAEAAAAGAGPQPEAAAPETPALAVVIVEPVAAAPASVAAAPDLPASADGAGPDAAPAASTVAPATLTEVERLVRGGDVRQAVDVAERLLAAGPARRQALADLGLELAAASPDGALLVVEVAADGAVAAADWAGAADMLQAFVARVPNHTGALMRLVEIAVDGGLEATMFRAQAQLADAYLASGSAAEARFIAEDLVAREPWDHANVDRFRQALLMLGETDPDLVIAERLSGQSLYAAGEVAWPSPELAEGERLDDLDSLKPPPDYAGVAATPSGLDASAEPVESVEPVESFESIEHDGAVAADDVPMVAAPVPTPEPFTIDPFALGPNAVDIGSILADFEREATEEAQASLMSGASHMSGEAAGMSREADMSGDDLMSGEAAGMSGEAAGMTREAAVSDRAEVDLSSVLEHIRRPGPVVLPDAGTARPPASRTPVEPLTGDNLDDVFATLRDEASRQSVVEAADQEYQRGLALYGAGQVDEAIPVLRAASRTPAFRFGTASLLGRIHRRRDALAEAIEWFERAAEAPAPSPSAGHQVLYELADALDVSGETVRALAAFMELQAEAGDAYRDVAARVERLAKAQVRG